MARDREGSLFVSRLYITRFLRHTTDTVRLFVNLVPRAAGSLFQILLRRPKPISRNYPTFTRASSVRKHLYSDALLLDTDTDHQEVHACSDTIKFNGPFRALFHLLLISNRQSDIMRTDKQKRNRICSRCLKFFVRFVTLFQYTRWL